MADGKIIYTVVIDRGEDNEPWVSSFDGKAKARAFVRKVNRKLKKYGIQSGGSAAPALITVPHCPCSHCARLAV
ncbi:MAG: hypothetical protein EOM68_25470 [Spirochaetia bacterium]|nr:hypothetical protein [Spirochaetia bacterium]